MKPTERDELLQQLHQAVIGISGNPDENGLIGDIKDIKTEVRAMNGAVKKNTAWRKVHTWLIGLLIPLVIALITISLNN